MDDSFGLPSFHGSSYRIIYPFLRSTDLCTLNFCEQKSGLLRGPGDLILMEKTEEYLDFWVGLIMKAWLE